ncbi:hypothetical protein [Actinomadura sp. 6N118]|uniref:hypothetical protein n=1 Tax=Actinomadura sp. 6N118 TaxID=3375151 RepID=UPI0037927614
MAEMFAGQHAGRCLSVAALPAMEMADGVREADERADEIRDYAGGAGSELADEGDEACSGAQVISSRRRRRNAAIGHPGSAIVGVGGLSQMLVARGPGSGVKNIGGCPAGITCCVRVDDRAAADLSGGVGSGTGGVVIDRLAFFATKVSIGEAGTRNAKVIVPSPLQARPGEIVGETSTGVPDGTSVAVGVLGQADCVAGDLV